MRLVSAVSAALVFACACTSSPQPAPEKAAKTASAPAKTKTASADPNRKVCKSETVIGRMVPVQTCHTAAEWDVIKNRQAETVRDAGRSVQSSAGTTPTSN